MNFIFKKKTLITSLNLIFNYNCNYIYIFLIYVNEYK